MLRSKRTSTVKNISSKGPYRSTEWRRESQYHLYADDIQMYGTSDSPTSLRQTCLSLFPCLFLLSILVDDTTIYLVAQAKLLGASLPLLSSNATSSSSIPSSELHLSPDHFPPPPVLSL